MARRRWAAGLAALTALTLTTSACGMGGDDRGSSGGSGGSGSSDGGHVVYAAQFTPRAAWAIETDDAFLLSNVGCLETLLRYDSDGSLQPMLAESFERTGSKTWEFALRPDVTFQDGTPMDAEAVVRALTHVLEAPTPARSFNPDTVSGVTAVDETTVEVETPGPDVLLPYRMASPNTGILAAKAFAEDRVDIVGTCTGPFAVTRVVGRQSVDLERNETYWGEKAQVATAEARFVIEGETRVTQLRTGEAQIVEGVPPSQQAALSGDDAVEIMSVPQPRTTSMILNVSRPPFDDPNVREALQLAVDTQAIADTIYEGGAIPAVGPFSPSDAWSPEGAEPVRADIEQARSLLDEAGVDPAELGFELIAYNDRPEFADLAAVIQDQLGALGVEVRIRTGEYASFEPDLLAGDFEAVLLSRGYLSDVGDPAGYLTADFACEGGYNLAHYCDPETDRMIEQATAVEEPEARYEMYAEIGERLRDVTAQVFLVHNTGISGVAAGVEGYEVHPLALYTLTSRIAVD